MRICVFLALLLALASVGLVHVWRYRSAQAELHQAQAESVTESFAAVAASWLSLGRKQSLDVFADVLLETGCTGIQFATGAGIAYERGDTGDWALLPTSEWTERSTLRGGGIAGTAYVETYLPVGISEGEPPYGYVRAGFSVPALSSAVRSRSATGILAWILMAGGLVAADWLLARHMRRAEPSEGSSIGVDESTRCVSVRGEGIELPPKQFALLACLAQEPGRVVADKELLEAVWPESDYADSKDVKQCVYLLRRSLRAVIDRPERVIRNVKGHGYRLDVSEV